MGCWMLWIRGRGDGKGRIGYDCVFMCMRNDL